MMTAGPDTTRDAPTNLVPRRYRGLNLLGIRAVFLRLVLGEVMFFKLVIFGPALQALLFALVISIAVGSRLSEVSGIPFLVFLAPGLIVAAAVQRSFETTAFMLVYEKLEGTIGDVFGAPLTPLEILMGYVLGAVATGFMIGLPVWIILLPFGSGIPVVFTATLYFAVFGCATLALVGLAAGMRSQRWDTLSAKETFILAPLLFLSGSFFSIEALSEPFRTAMLFNPIFHLVNGFRYGMTGHAEVAIWISAIVVFGLFAAMAFATHYMIRIGYRIKA